MPVEIDEAINANEKLRPLVKRADQILSGVLGVANDRVDRRWRRSEDSGQSPNVTLDLNDEGIVSGTLSFTPDQLADPDDLEGRLLRFWGNLLRDKSHRQEEKVRRLVEALED